MTDFRLFDAIELTEAVVLATGDTAPVGTPGTVVEILGDGEAYLVELFGGWVKADAAGALVPAQDTDPSAFVETIGVEVVRPPQLKLVKVAMKTMGVRSHLLATLDELPEALVVEVADFAEFLRHKQQRQATAVERVP